MKKLAPVIMIIFLLSTCKSFNLNRKPEATIEKFDIESISLRDITFLFGIGIDNPYPIGIKLDDIKIKFNVEGNQLFKTTTSKGLKINAFGKEVSTFNINLKYADIMNVVKAYTSKDYLDCDIDIDMVIPLPKIAGLQKSLPLKFKLKKQIPAIKPSLKIANFTVKKPSLSDITDSLSESGKDAINSRSVLNMFNDMLSGKNPKKIIDPSKLDLKLTVDFDIELQNNTKAKLLFQDLNYDFFVNSNKLVNGSTSNIQNIGSKSVIKVSNKFSSKVLGTAVLNAFNNKKGEYKLTGYSFIKLPDSIKKDPVKLIFNERGEMQIK